MGTSRRKFTSEFKKKVVLEALKVRLMAQLNDKEKSTVMSIIDTMLTKQKFQEFFQQNISPQ